MRRPKHSCPDPESFKPEVERALDKMNGVPVDIEPKFTTAEQLVRENP